MRKSVFPICGLFIWRMNGMPAFDTWNASTCFRWDFPLIKNGLVFPNLIFFPPSLSCDPLFHLTRYCGLLHRNWLKSPFPFLSYFYFYLIWSNFFPAVPASQFSPFSAKKWLAITRALDVVNSWFCPNSKDTYYITSHITTTTQICDYQYHYHCHYRHYYNYHITVTSNND